jgi:hypothetical protein
MSVSIAYGTLRERKFTKEFVGYDVKTVPQMGWAGVKNGQLLALAEAEFDVFITVDRNLSFQQNLPQFNMAVIVLQAPSNRLADLKPCGIRTTHRPSNGFHLLTRFGCVV